jgi:hypothetical protein
LNFIAHREAGEDDSCAQSIVQIHSQLVEGKGQHPQSTRGETKKKRISLSLSSVFWIERLASIMGILAYNAILRGTIFRKGLLSVTAFLWPAAELQNAGMHDEAGSSLTFEVPRCVLVLVVLVGPLPLASKDPSATVDAAELVEGDFVRLLYTSQVMAHFKANALLRLIIVATMLFSVSALRSLRSRSNSLRALIAPRAALPSRRPLSSPFSRQPRSLHSSHTRHTRLFSKAKPDFTQEAASKYFDFQRLEGNIYEWWEEQGYFKPDESPSNTKEPFVIPMPPPNVTGYLHMGHAIFVALQDIMARYQRMRGRPTLWLPGTDHAGIATQLLVERQLAAEGTSRKDLGREAFIKRVWEWKEEKGGYITQQMRRLGASADWSREKFTLEEDMSSAVTGKDLYVIQLYSYTAKKTTI